MEVSNADRIIVLVDMDCFYVQVEQKLCPEYQNKPCAVVQYKTWKGGGIIAVNYEARAKGVTRFLRGAEAQEVCPDIHLFRVPEVRGKSDLTRYREAGALVLDALCEYSDCVERASIDEAYLDLTSVINEKIQSAPHVTSDQLQNTFVVGWEGEDPESRKEGVQKWLQMIYEEEHLYHDRMLALAAVTVEEMRNAVYEKTGYRCSAGIAHNKMLSKLSCGIHKPNKQTVLPQSSIQLLFKTIPIKKVRNLGGKLGQAIAEKFNVEKVGDLIDISKSQFAKHFGEKTGHWLYNLVRGIDSEPVTSRQLPKSIGCGKNFPGKTSLSTRNDVVHWLNQLATELEERLIKDQKANRRFARLLTISIRSKENDVYSVSSRSCTIQVYNAEKLAHDALLAITKLNTSSSDTLWKPSIWTLSMAAGKFEDKLDSSHCNIESYFNKESFIQTENTSFKSVASTSTESIDVDQTFESLDNSSLKDSKNNVSKKSIVSFFTKKLQVKAESESIDVDQTFESLDNSLKDSKRNVSKKSIVNFFTKKLQDKAESFINTGIMESASDEKVKSELNSTNIGSEKQRTEPSYDLESLETVKSENVKVNEAKPCNGVNSVDLGINESIAEKMSVTDENTEIASSEKQSKPLGFFAKKLKERAEINFNVEFETSCDSVTDILIENEQTELHERPSDAAPATLVNEQNLCSSNCDSDVYPDLDPELTKLCEQCNKRIPIWEEIEHSDYHLALNISKEFSSKPSMNNSCYGSKLPVTGKSITTKSKRGRKRGSAVKSSTQIKKPTQTKTLDAFFR